MIGAVLAWVIGPVGRWFGLAVLLVAAYASLSLQQRSIGASNAETKIERANSVARDKADAAQQQVLDCPAGHWVRGEGCKK